MLGKFQQECPRRTMKVRKWVWTGTATALVLIVGVVVAITLLLTNDQQKNTTSESNSNSKNNAPFNASISPAPVAFPWSTMAPSLLNLSNPASVNNETEVTSAPLAPSTSVIYNSTVAPAVTPPPITFSPTYLNEPITTIFYAHGDIPYNDSQKVVLEQQMKTVPLDAEFQIFVGDLREAGDDKPCLYEEYADIAALFRLSHAPVFVIQGDNDISDCPNLEDGKKLWRDHFIGFESKYWNHTFDVQRQVGYPDNFAFLHKKTLFMGLNIIGYRDGEKWNETEWEIRLSDEASWTMELIRTYHFNKAEVGRVVIFGHANPGARHATYFETISSFIAFELQNSIPILYLHGDRHAWMYEPVFYGNDSWLRIGVTGLGEEPLLKVTIEADGTFVNPEQAFEIDRMLTN